MVPFWRGSARSFGISIGLSWKSELGTQTDKYVGDYRIQQRAITVRPTTLSRGRMLAEKLAQIEEFLAGKGIALQVKRQPPLNDNEIAKAEKILGHPMPGDLREIYLGFANGFCVDWDDVRSAEGGFARFSLASIEAFMQGVLEFREETRDYYENAENYFDRPEEARLVLRRMLNWGVLWAVGDGDCVCIDLESGAVVFHEREWSFHKTYINGYLIAPNFNSLIEDWGNVCFLFFVGCPGWCPSLGGSAVPNYDGQKYNMVKEEKQQRRAPNRR